MSTHSSSTGQASRAGEQHETPQAMAGFVRATLTQTVLLNISFCLLIVVGAYSLLTISVERYPKIQFGQALIFTSFPGANPTEVETLVTRKIEDSLEDLEDVEYIKSSSYQGLSVINVKFEDDTDYDNLYRELRFRALAMQNELPDEVDPSDFNMITTDDWLPVLSLNLTGPRTNRALALMADAIKVQLRQVPGVQEVKLRGEYDREFHVYVDPERMTRLGVTFDQVANALIEANVSVPAGDYKDVNGGSFVVKVDEKFRDREAVMRAIIRSDADGSFVRVADVASTARQDYRDPTVIASVNGNESVSLKIIKQASANAMDIKKGVEKVMAEFEADFAREQVSMVITEDSTNSINDAMSTLGQNLLVGMVLVSLILWYFMGFRNAGLVTMGIPFSFMVTMILMSLTGNSLNEITLFSFVLVSGIIVDDAIVVLENIYRYVQEGADIVTAVVSGTAEVFWPVVSATTTTVAAFLPMLIMTGSTGEFFALIPKAVTFALVASLVECLLMLPIHYLDFGPRGKKHAAKAKRSVQAQDETAANGGKQNAVDLSDLEGPKEKDNFVLALARAVTTAVCSITLRFRWLTVATMVVAFAASAAVLVVSILGVAPLVKIKFFPDDYTIYNVVLKAPVHTPIEDVHEKIKEISEFIMDDGPGMAAATTGYAGMYVDESYEEVYGDNYGFIQVTMPVREDQHFADYPENNPLDHLDWMRERLVTTFAGNFSLEVRAQSDGPPTGKDVSVRVVGRSTERVKALAEYLLSYLEKTPDIGPYLLNLETDEGRPSRVYRLSVQKERVAEYGLSADSVAYLAGSVLDGRYIGKFRFPDEEVDLKLRLNQDWLTSPEKSLALPLVEHPTGPIRLGDLVSVRAYTEPDSLKRYNSDRAITVTANLAEGSPTSVPAIVAQLAREYRRVQENYPGASIIFAGEHEDTQRSYTSLTYAFLIAILVIYMILATQFKSYFQPMIILSAVMFSLIGVVTGKLVTQSLFTVNSFIAVVGVTGVVVNDSLVLIDFINRAYVRGLSRRDAIWEGIRVRLRPILLTTLTTTLGLLPMALGIPYYSLVWGTMASTFVTGLCTATMLTLFVVPVLWDLLEGARLTLLSWRGKQDKRYHPHTGRLLEGK